MSMEIGGKGVKSDINVTPLVDVVLVLLIIFMVTATYIVKESIEVDLPRAAHAGEATGSVLAVVLTREGEVYLDGVRADERQLEARVRAAVAVPDRPRPQAVRGHVQEPHARHPVRGLVRDDVLQLHVAVGDAPGVQDQAAGTGAESNSL